MGKSLVIVESPAKAKTINKYLGNQFVVKSSIGHIRDLPTSGSSSSKEPAAKGRKSASEAPALSPKEKARRQLVSRMGVDPEHGWKAKYEILPGKEKVIEELRRLAKDADTIYLATDLDREGEAISWHLAHLLEIDPHDKCRIMFHEITKKAILEAIKDPEPIDLKKVDAQQARRAQQQRRRRDDEEDRPAVPVVGDQVGAGDDEDDRRDQCWMKAIDRGQVAHRADASARRIGWHSVRWHTGG